MWNIPENQIKLTLVRHGRTKGNTEGRYIGRTDEELSAEGINEIKSIKYPPADMLFASPMKRCLQTAEIIYPNQKVITVDALAEMDFGLAEGKNYIELMKQPYYQQWIDSNGIFPFPGGESREAFSKRTMKGFHQMMETIIRQYPRKAVRVTAIVHGGTIMSILSTLDGGDYYDYQIGNGKGYVGESMASDQKVQAAGKGWSFKWSII